MTDATHTDGHHAGEKSERDRILTLLRGEMDHAHASGLTTTALVLDHVISLIEETSPGRTV